MMYDACKRWMQIMTPTKSRHGEAPRLRAATALDPKSESACMLSAPDELAALRVAIAEVEAGDVYSAEEVRAGMRARGRLLRQWE